MSVAQPPLLPPPLNKATKPKRSVSFLSHAVLPLPSDNSSPTNPAPGRLGRSSFQPGKRPGYVRKGPVQSDSGSDDEDDDRERGDGSGDDHDKDEISAANSDHSSRKVTQPFNNSAFVTKSVVARPGQNYVRKAPVNSDSESDEDHVREKTPPQQQQRSNPTAKADDISSDTESERDSKGVPGLVQSFAHSRISGPGQNYVRKAPVNSDTESDEDKLSGKAKGRAARNAVGKQGLGVAGTHTGPGVGSRPLNVPVPTTSWSAELAPIGGSISPASTRVSPPTSTRVSPPATAALHGPLSTSPSTGYAPGLGMGMGNSSNTSMGGSTAPASIANSMALYQQQQQEMMMIMQQQQIQIATMQQQQQAYQLYLLQQQQQHQQQLQAVQLQHSRNSSSNGSAHTPNGNGDDDDDDDVPLSDKKLHLPNTPQTPGLQSGTSPLQLPPQMLAGLPTVHLSPDVHSSILSLPFSALPHSRQASSSSVHSLNSPTPNPLIPQYHLQPMVSSPLNPAMSSPLLQPQALHHPYQQQYHGNVQPRIADFIVEDEQEHMLYEQGGGMGGAKVLTSGFPAGYRNSLGSVSLSQLNLDRGSATSPYYGGPAGSKPNPSRAMQHQTLIHVEAKPPPPQTGLVGTITAMEREKKMAKAQGTNQLQFQHQQQQQMMMANVEKERWLQEQRRQAWETEQQQQHPQQQQQQQPFCLPAIPNIPLWEPEDDEDDNRPLGGAH